MIQHKECIHWEVCARACPTDSSECDYYEQRHLPTEGKWLKVEGVNAYQCSNCNTLGDHTRYYCATCGSKNVMEE